MPRICKYSSVHLLENEVTVPIFRPCRGLDVQASMVRFFFTVLSASIKVIFLRFCIVCLCSKQLSWRSQVFSTLPLFAGLG